GNAQKPVESDAVATKFVTALLRHDAHRARSLIDPRSQPDDGSVEGIIATLKRFRVPVRPIRIEVRHDCTPPIAVVGDGRTVGRDCSTFAVGDNPRSGRASLRVWLGSGNGRVSAFTFHASPRS